MKKHKDWSGKECPRKLIPIWAQFVADVKETLLSMDKKQVTEVAAWKNSGVEYLHSVGVLTDKEGWLAQLDEPMSVWAVTTMLANMHQSLKK